ncbi:MAG: hypothetical protein IKY52_00345, partial [Clostridia bacterium]|nr:hypothetical protein [Clostridia bacterium]
MNRKTLSLLLCALMLAPGFASCGNTAAETESADTAAVTETAAQTEETSYLASLPTVDYDGMELCMIAKNSADLPTTIILCEGEMTGEPINDAIYQRDEQLSDRYNVKIVNVVDSSIGKEDKRSAIAAGDAPWEVLWENMASTGLHLVSNNMVYPLNYVENIDLSQPCWEQTANEALKIGDSIYFPTGPIAPKYYGSVYVILFNREMAEDLGLRDYYTTVEEGKWTLDLLMQDARTATSDLDGNGTLTDDDRLGFAYEVLTTDALVLGAGHHFVRQEDNKMHILYDDENLVNTMQTLMDFYQEDCVVWMDGGKFDYSKLLTSGRILFGNPCTFNIAGYRDFDYDFGVLPMPKGAETQDKYISYAQPWATATPFVPVTVQGETRAMTGMLLQAMAAYGLEELKPVVLNDVITLKNTRDEQSARIVEQLFECVTFDLMTILNPGDLYNQV